MKYFELSSQRDRSAEVFGGEGDRMVSVLCPECQATLRPGVPPRTITLKRDPSGVLSYPTDMPGLLVRQDLWEVLSGWGKGLVPWPCVVKGRRGERPASSVLLPSRAEFDVNIYAGAGSQHEACPACGMRCALDASLPITIAEDSLGQRDVIPADCLLFVSQRVAAACEAMKIPDLKIEPIRTIPVSLSVERPWRPRDWSPKTVAYNRGAIAALGVLRRAMDFGPHRPVPAREPPAQPCSREPKKPSGEGP